MTEPKSGRTILNVINEYAPLSWLALIAISCSILVTLHILFSQLQPTWSKLRFDKHFQARFAVVILLLANRIVHLVQVLVYHYQLANENKYFDDISNFLTAAFYIILLCMLALLYLLTINRYKRVAMVLPNTREFTICRMFESIAIVCALYDGITFLLFILKKHEIIIIQQEYLVLMDDKMYFKVGSFIFNHIVYYAFTIRLIVLSARSGRIATQGIGKQLVHLVWKRSHKSPSFAVSASQDHHKCEMQGSLDAEVIQLKRIYAGMKMIGIFALLSLVDFFMLILVVYSYLSGLNTIAVGSLAAIATSWIVLHVWCEFQLLDMFVKDLIKANRGEASTLVTRLALVMKRLWRNAWNRSFSRDSVTTDMVDLSLISETHLTTVKKPKRKEKSSLFIKETAVLVDTSHALTTSGMQSASVEYSKLQTLPSSAPV